MENQTEPRPYTSEYMEAHGLCEGCERPFPAECTCSVTEPRSGRLVELARNDECQYVVTFRILHADRPPTPASVRVWSWSAEDAIEQAADEARKVGVLAESAVIEVTALQGRGIYDIEDEVE